MSAKRYNIKSEIDLSAWIEEYPEGILVMANDYDDTMAELNHERSLRETQAESMLTRIRDLEAALVQICEDETLTDSGRRFIAYEAFRKSIIKPEYSQASGSGDANG
jgi:hypothetical protein